eukprot:CAMPEP_0181315304 /NCGR_PEP_ID=MMETSP1101-20121128/15302_1 /TAXON_ID=46948 /ORGANISM="Rhodomonas abbreviata, Strain Caron Lab Isolate" /LENGTH=75 /DNA_ID=CAMNT_0023422499 /DNA_START=185 /DNA_END=412 /DNA_ORIENTATION=+
MPAGLISPLAQAFASKYDGAGPSPGSKPAGTPGGSASESICMRPCFALKMLLGSAGALLASPTGLAHPTAKTPFL